jgi:hypothetical protein
MKEMKVKVIIKVVIMVMEVMAGRNRDHLLE